MRSKYMYGMIFSFFTLNLNFLWACLKLQRHWFVKNPAKIENYKEMNFFFTAEENLVLMQWSYPNNNFPAHPQSSGTRQLFSNYGAGLLNCDNVDQLDSQRLRHQGGLVRQYMTVPLRNSPVEGIK